jgi:hypothetical protein
MPKTLQYEMELIAEVVRVDEKGDSFINAARILVIEDEARDAIVQVVFQKQRKEIRMEKIGQRDNDGD